MSHDSYKSTFAEVVSSEKHKGYVEFVYKRTECQKLYCQLGYI